MTREELVKTLKEYYSIHGNIEIPYNDDYSGKEVKETIFKTLGLDAESIESIENNLRRFDYYYRDMQISAANECIREIKNILKKMKIKGLQFDITDCVDNVLEEMLEAAEDYSYTLREGLKNDYKNEEDWKEDLEYFLEEASWLK
jgi:hypothetical protein